MESESVWTMEIIKPLSQVEIKIGFRISCTYATQKYRQTITLTLIQMQQLPDIYKDFLQTRNFFPKWTIKNSKRKVCVNYQTDWYQLIIIVYRYRKTYIWKIRKRSWKRQKTKSFVLNKCIFWDTLTSFSGGALYWKKQLFIIKTNFVRNGCSLPYELFPNATGI